MKTTYTASNLLPGAGEILRERSFTRWMSPDLRQSCVEFVKTVGLLPIYTECSPENLGRYLFWHPPEDCRFEIRSGRTYEQFEAYDAANISHGFPLLSLHINENKIYSAVWISGNHEQTAKQVLASYGITPAGRTLSI
jgi:hypothetical protein